MKRLFLILILLAMPMLAFPQATKYTLSFRGGQVDTILTQAQYVAGPIWNVKNPPFNAPADGLTDARSAIQRAIDTCAGEGFGGGTVYIPDGKYLINNAPGKDYGLVVKVRVHLVGSGQTISGATQYGGAQLIYGDNQNGTMIVDSDYVRLLETGTYNWWHWASIENLSLDCNGVNNDTANGIHIYRSGETSTIQNVTIANYKGFGIKITASAPFNMQNVTINPDSTATITERTGMWCDSSGTNSIINLSGDENNPLLKVSNGGNTHVFGLKAEDKTSDSTGNPVVLIDTVASQAAISIRGFTALRTPSSPAYGEFCVVRGINSSNLPQVVLDAGQVAGYKSYYRTIIGGVTSDSISNFPGADQGINQIRDGYSINWMSNPTIPAGTGGVFFYNNYDTITGKIQFATDGKLHFRSPEYGMEFETRDDRLAFGMDWNIGWGTERVKSYWNFQVDSGAHLYVGNPTDKNHLISVSAMDSGQAVIAIERPNIVAWRMGVPDDSSCFVISGDDTISKAIYFRINKEDSTVEAVAGGFRFPDGTVQTTAGVGGSDTVAQRNYSNALYEAKATIRVLASGGLIDSIRTTDTVGIGLILPAGTIDTIRYDALGAVSLTARLELVTSLGDASPVLVDTTTCTTATTQDYAVDGGGTFTLTAGKLLRLVFPVVGTMPKEFIVTIMGHR